MKKYKWLVPTLYIIFLMLPIYWLINMSFKTTTEIINTYSLWPQKFSTENNLVLHGNNGFSKKSQYGAASHYYSQPFYSVKGWVILNGDRHSVEGVGWLDREWSSNLLNKNQLGWDWFSLHLNNGRKVMLFKVRHASGNDFLSGSWIDQDGTKKPINASDLQLKETAYSTVKGRKIPTKWKISFLGSNSLTITIEACLLYTSPSPRD